MNVSMLDRLKPWIVLTFAVTQIAASFLPQVLGWPQSIITRSIENETPAVPISFAFAIWSLIFLGSLSFAVFGLLPKNRQNLLWHHVAWLAALVFALNTLWEIYVPLRNLDWGALLIIAAAAATAITIAFRIAAWPSPLTKGERWCVAMPMQVFAGWLSAATFVGFPSTLVWAGITLVDPRSDIVAIAVICGATLLACAVILATRAFPYALTISWALVGVVIANIIRDDRPIIVAAAMIALLFVIGAVTTALRRARRLSPAFPSGT